MSKSSVVDRKKQWVDEEDEDDLHHISANGIKERSQFSENSKGQKVKTTSKYQVREIKIRTPKRVLARRNLEKFGEAHAGEENVTLMSKDFVTMEHPDDQLVEDVDDPTIKNTLAEFIRKQQERTLQRECDTGLNDVVEVDKSAETEPNKGGKYVAPRPGGASASGLAGNDSQAENTLRVSNLSKAVTEDDLRDLFEPFGRVLRVSLPRVERQENGKMIKEPRGFAYIAFLRKEDAEKALDRLQGYGYDHLIIKLEWAKPTKDGPPTGSGGLSAGYSSGYGKQLAQDTKQKVSYASNKT